MKTAYFDCIAGASGDMLLGALIDAGFPAAELDAELDKLNLFDFQIEYSKVSKNGFGATKVDVHCQDDAPERRLREIRELIESSDILPAVKTRAMKVFTRICEVEAGIHGMPIDQVHLHEVGGVDAIVDVVGVLSIIERMEISRIVVSPLPMGRGFVNGAHGQIPLPAPATVALLQGVPIIGSSIDKELVTPTGAALLVELTDTWGPLPAMTLRATGYGAGSRDLAIPNVLRVLIGDCADACPWLTRTLTELETHLDNDRGETLGHATRRLMEEGALDVILIPAQMKKGRPAHILKVLVNPEDADRLQRIVFEETSTLGVRRTDVRRDSLPRHFETLETDYGPIRFKVATLPDGTRRASPEYEDCREAAARHGVALPVVLRAAEGAASRRI